MYIQLSNSTIIDINDISVVYIIGLDLKIVLKSGAVLYINYINNEDLKADYKKIFNIIFTSDINGCLN